jgi:hypothetical protein
MIRLRSLFYPVGGAVLARFSTTFKIHPTNFEQLSSGRRMKE